MAVSAPMVDTDRREGSPLPSKSFRKAESRLPYKELRQQTVR